MLPQAFAPLPFCEHGGRIDWGLGEEQGVPYNGDMGVRSGITWLELVIFGLLLLAMGWGAMKVLGDLGSSPHERNRQRSEDVRSLGNATTLYALEHNGRYPEGIGETAKAVCQERAVSCEGMLDLRAFVPRYIEHVPMDPFAVGVDDTFYTIHREGKKIIITAPYAEGGEVIRVER